MNANELDQFIKNNSKSVIELQETIRQQQAEIEELKKLVHQRFDDGKRLGVIETEDRLRKAQ